MKIWNIVEETSNSSIQVSNITVLKKQHITWYHLIRKMDDFFNNRKTTVQIYEDTQLLNRNDWECFLIPYNAHIQLEKVTSRSPLKDIQNHATEQIMHSPFYREIQSIWELLNDELLVMNEKLKQWGIVSTLREMDSKKLAEFVSFESVIGEMTPFSAKELLLNLALDATIDKQTLIIIELPELYTDDAQLDSYIEMIVKAANKGHYFMIVTDINLEVGSSNSLYQNKIINDATIRQMKMKTVRELPYYCDDALYEEATSIFLRLVDNSISVTEMRNNLGSKYDSIITLISLFMYNLNIDTMLDLEGIQPNLRSFIESYK